jgi:hypothetical protein
MRNPADRRHDEIDALLSGLDRAPEGAELAAALRRLRGSLTQPPADDVTSRHIEAMTDAAVRAPVMGRWRERVAGLFVRPEPAFRRAPRWAGLGILSLLGFIGGLAAAGALPDPAQRIVASTVGHVGIDIPNPSDEGSEHGNIPEGTDEHGEPPVTPADDHSGDVGTENNEHGKTVASVAQDDSLEGCEHGMAVRDVASSKNQADEDAVGHSQDHDPCAAADAESSDEGDEAGDEGGDDAGGPPASTGLDRADDVRNGEGPGSGDEHGQPPRSDPDPDDD